MIDVGLEILTLSKSAGTLSGGEAQRVKLATGLSKRPTGKTQNLSFILSHLVWRSEWQTCFKARKE